MTQTAKIEMTANDQGVLQVLQKQGRAMDSLADKLTKIERAGERGSRKVETGFNKAGSAIRSAATQLVGFGGALGSITMLVTTIKREMEDLRRRDQEAKTAQMTAGEAVRAARINFVPDASLKDNQLEQQLQAVAARTRTPVGTVASAFSSAASAKGSLTNMEALRAVEAAFTLRPGDLVTGTELGSRALDITKLAPGLDPRAAVGFMTNVQSAARVTELGQLGQTAPTAISAAVAAGDTAEQGAEMFATITNLLADAEGRKSSTLAKQLIAMTSAFVPAGRGKDERGGFRIPKDQMAAFEAAQGPTARLEMLQQNPELRRDFMARNSFAAETRVAAERLLSGEAGALRELRQARQVINPLDARQEGAFDAKVAQLEGGQFQPVLSAEQGTQAATERARLRNGIGARRAAARAALEAGLTAAGVPATERMLQMGRFDYGTGTADPEQSAIGILQGQTRDIQRRLDESANRGFFPTQRVGDVPIITDEQKELAKEQLRALQEQTTVLQQLREDTRRRDPPNQRRQPAAAALGRRQ